MTNGLTSGGGPGYMDQQYDKLSVRGFLCGCDVSPIWEGSIHLQPCNEADNNFQETSPLGAGRPAQQIRQSDSALALTNFSRCTKSSNALNPTSQRRPTWVSHRFGSDQYRYFQHGDLPVLYCTSTRVTRKSVPGT